jgi:DNA-directed RNA polymerase alpha subunit
MVPANVRHYRVDDYEVSARTLAALSDAELLRVPTLGRKTLDEIKRLLRALGDERV